MQPQRLIGQPMDTDDHRRGYVSRLNGFAPLRDQLTVPREHDGLGRSRRTYTVTCRPPSYPASLSVTSSPAIDDIVVRLLS
jgi:hypothetical protein